MTLFRKSLALDVHGRAQRIAGAVTRNHSREFGGAARQYVGEAGLAVSRAGRQVKRHPRAALLVGGLGVAAIATAWLLMRRRPLAEPQRDEHDPFHEDAAAANDASVVPGETGLY
ncbi:hypothetical protein P3W23_11715 [Luteibacter sp. PPL554]